jgi:hypothetical protein
MDAERAAAATSSAGHPCPAGAALGGGRGAARRARRRPPERGAGEFPALRAADLASDRIFPLYEAFSDTTAAAMRPMLEFAPSRGGAIPDRMG